MNPKSENAPTKPKKGKPAICHLMGDVHRLRYNSETNSMTAEIQMSPADVRRFLETMAGCFEGEKGKRKQRIHDLADELAKLIWADGSFYVRGTAFVSHGSTVYLTNDGEPFASIMRDGGEIPKV